MSKKTDKVLEINNCKYINTKYINTEIKIVNFNPDVLEIKLEIEAQETKKDICAFYCDSSLKEYIEKLLENGYKFTVVFDDFDFNSYGKKGIIDSGARYKYLAITNIKKENTNNFFKLIFFHYVVMAYFLFEEGTNWKEKNISSQLSINIDLIKKELKSKHYIIDHKEKISEELHLESMGINPREPYYFNKILANNCFSNLCFLSEKINSNIKSQKVDNLNKNFCKDKNKNKKHIQSSTIQNILISNSIEGDYNFNILLKKAFKFEIDGRIINTDNICILNKFNIDGNLNKIERKLKEAEEINKLYEEMEKVKLLDNNEEEETLRALEHLLISKTILVEDILALEDNLSYKDISLYFKGEIPLDKKEKFRKIEKFESIKNIKIY